MSPDSVDPSIGNIPSLERVAPYYDQLLGQAADRLDRPIQTRVRTWEDGEFEIRVYHGYGPHPARPRTTYEHVLRLHSEDDHVEEGLMAVDVESGEKRLIHRETVVASGVRIDAGRTPQKIEESAGGD